MLHTSADPEADLKRADELASRLLVLDPNYWEAHAVKGQVLRAAGHLNDAISEYEHALALNPNAVDALSQLGMTYCDLGQYEKAIEFLDKALRLSPYDPSLVYWYLFKSKAYLALHQDDQAIEFARRSIASNQDFGPAHGFLAAALALTGREAEARDEIQRLNALSPTKSIAALKAAFAPPPSADPRVRASFDRFIEGLRKAGMPEE